MSLQSALQSAYEEEIFIPLRLRTAAEGVALVALDRGMAAQFTRMLQRGEIRRLYRLRRADCLTLEELAENQDSEDARVQLASLRFRDPMGSAEEIEITVDTPQEW